MSVLRVGKFKEGFVSAGFSQVMEVTGGYRRLGMSSAARYAKNAALSTVVGGTASKLVGGKFANGAITGAFPRMFNVMCDHGNSQRASKKSALHGF